MSADQLRTRNKQLLLELQAQRARMQRLGCASLRENGQVLAEDRKRRASARSARLETRPRPYHAADEINCTTPPSPEGGAARQALSDRHALQPLLGYDWIAGLLDVEPLCTERSDQFYQELQAFRRTYIDECVPRQPGGVAEGKPPIPLLTCEEVHHPSTHRCTFCYRINSRLFAVPLDPQERCPGCRQPRAARPFTQAEPAHVRVSIPRCSLLPPHQYPPHRRSSFDASASLSLPSHCLSGWTSAGHSVLPGPSPLDLRSNLHASATPLQSSANQEQEGPLSRKDRRGNISCLARYSFQHRPAHPRTHPMSSSS